MTSRRGFVKLLGTAVVGSLLGRKAYREQTALAISATPIVYQGSDLANWEVVVGDGVYTASGEPPVTEDDIETTNFGEYSELKANIQQRRIMAHNITFKRIIDNNAFNFIHTCGYKFRLPYMPSTSNIELNPQTIEGGLFIWDGSNTRLDYGIAFQWMLNPWGGSDFNFGDVRCWTSDNDGSWVKVGDLTPDTLWHEIKFIFDFGREMTALIIDDKHYPSSFSAIKKPDTWGTETAARLQAEIISLYPGEGNGTLHKTECKDWSWVWEPSERCNAFLPLVTT